MCVCLASEFCLFQFLLNSSARIPKSLLCKLYDQYLRKYIISSFKNIDIYMFRWIDFLFHYKHLKLYWNFKTYKHLKLYWNFKTYSR